MKIALTTDHAGFEMLKELKQYLELAGHECVDFGPDVFDSSDDYPGFMFAAAQAVANGECERGIILGGSGQGEAIAANRIRGVRCALFYGTVTPRGPINIEGNVSDDPYIHVRLSRQHNHTNMLSLGARFVSLDDMKEVSDIWLREPTSNAERHVRRVQQLDDADDSVQ